MATATTTPAPAPGRPPQRRFTVDEYHKLLELGFLRDRDPCELLNGIIIVKMPQNTPHASVATRLERRLGRLLPDQWLLRTDKPVTLAGSDSEPEPDLAVVSGPEEKYDEKHPRAGDIALIVEVADSSLVLDQGEKLQVYAAAKIAVYWVVNIPDRRVEVYTDPRGGKNPAYRTKAEYSPGDAVPVVVGGKELGTIPTSELLP